MYDGLGSIGGRAARKLRLLGKPAEGLPLPPPEMRRLVGCDDAAAFDNPTRSLVYPYLPPDAYDAVLDFGCGCGRVARQLIQQRPRPKRYLGVDIHGGMINWCSTNLTPRAPEFEFAHLDVFSASMNPGSDKAMYRPVPTADDEFTLFEACSVFTHLVQSQTVYYLQEAARVLRRRGHLHATWFLFDKTELPMLNESQNALYTNEYDLSSAVIYDRDWVRRTAAAAGLTIVHVVPPKVRNFHWYVVMTNDPTAIEIDFPADVAPVGRVPAPSLPARASEIGMSAGA